MHGDGSRAGCRFQMGMRGRTAPLGTKPEMDPERSGQGAGETWASLCFLPAPINPPWDRGLEPCQRCPQEAESSAPAGRGVAMAES